MDCFSIHFRCFSCFKLHGVSYNFRSYGDIPDLTVFLSGVFGKIVVLYAELQIDCQFIFRLAVHR
jgi:hypothetical protein